MNLHRSIDFIIMDEDLTKYEAKLDRKLSLNFADKDEKENAKFNDARLVDILRNYPLLYNKSLESYGDPDYTQWMWSEIANEMNEPHRKTTLNLPFNWTTCRDQWEIVKRSLRYLSNPAAKSFRYPKQFKECVDFFQNYIRDRSEPTHTDRPPQDIFLSFSNLLEQLPFEKQLLLEKEALDLVLTNELEYCAPMVDPDAVEAQAMEDFGSVIGLLMPEVDVQTVHNELSTEPETELGFLEEIIEKPETNTILFTTQPIEIKHDIDLNEMDLKNVIEVQNGHDEDNEATELENNIHYTIQEVPGVDDLIEEDDGEDDDGHMDGQGVISNHNGIEECAFEEVEEENFIQEEDLIEEVISDGCGKEVLPLNISGGYDLPGTKLDFDGVLNEMLG